MKSVLIRIIRIYQAFTRTPSVSSMWGWSGCRFQPTCSDYAVEMVNQHGILRGTLKSMIRVAQCNPFTPVRQPSV